MIVVLLFIFGCIVGSFLNVVIVRTREEGSVVKPRSRCPHCHQALSGRDMIPLVSFFLRRGRCRYCNQAISWQYPLVELATGLVCALLFILHFGASPTAPFDSLSLYLRDVVIGVFLILIFVYDIRYQLVPDWFVMPPIAIAFIWNIFLGKSIEGIILGGIGIGGIFFLQYIISRGRWIGLGDALIGCLLGVYLGLIHGLVTVWFAYVGGALVVAVMLVVKKADRKTRIPLGAYLIAATFFTIGYGEAMLEMVRGALR